MQNSRTDEDARDRELILRVAGGPGDVVEGRDGTVFVNDVKFDDITTEPFLSVRVPNEQYFLLGDNRSVAIDSRTFGTVLGDPIFGKVFVTFWPLRDFSFRMGRESRRAAGRDRLRLRAGYFSSSVSIRRDAIAMPMRPMIAR